MCPALLLTLAQTVAGDQQGLYTKVAWVLLGGILLAFLLFGLADLRRLSWARISAISSVSFDESIRRRVLWVTPLAIVGAVVVSQLQHAVDPQDAIRQTTKICLFATGLVVTLVAIVLASSNLQKEIETRVIYTVVTKPTTRLEIVLGKVWGFAKVSAAILLIMGVFTYAYLKVRAWRIDKVIAAQLEAMRDDKHAVNRDSLEHYHEAGLLNAKAMTPPVWLQLLSRPPIEGQPKWLVGGQSQRFALKFTLTPDDVTDVESAIKAGAVRIAFVIDVPVVVHEPTPKERELATMTAIPLRDDAAGSTTAPTTSPSDTRPTTAAKTAPSTSPSTSPSTAPATAPSTAPTELTGRAVPKISVSVLTPKREVILQPNELGGGSIELPTAPGQKVQVPITGESAIKLFEAGEFVFNVEGTSPAVEYAVGEMPVTLQVLRPDNTPALEFKPDVEPGGPKATGAMGRYGVQLIGGPEGHGGLAVFHYEGVKPSAAEGDHLILEVKAGIERGGDYSGETEVLPEVILNVYDSRTGVISDPLPFHVETNRISYVSVPKSFFPEDGNFEVLLRVVTPDQWLGVLPETVSVATGSRSFAWNLAKSLLILWAMSILVVAIAIFCSTFVSWPIAVVLTLLILFGRWGVQQVGESGGPGLGAQMTGQTADSTRARFTRTTIDTLTKTLVIISAFLPDVASFQATADIERGISIPLSRFGDAGWVLLGYGVPMVILAYLVLKRKEVAP